MPPSSDRILVQFRCKPWVRRALRRGAYESEKSLSRYIADFLESCCEGEPEDPARQARNTPESPPESRPRGRPTPAAPSGPPPFVPPISDQPRHRQRPVDEMPDFESPEN
jgi:hypothetical protein